MTALILAARFLAGFGITLILCHATNAATGTGEAKQ